MFNITKSEGQRGSLLTLRCPNNTPWSLAASCEDMMAAPQLCEAFGLVFQGLEEGGVNKMHGGDGRFFVLTDAVAVAGV